MRTLRDTQPGAGGEVQLMDALRDVIVHGGRVLGVRLLGG
jgi:UTP-glucose-1-phosphate uridylyltransferase